MSQVFDDKELLERIDNDWEFLAEAVQMLAADGPVLLDGIRKSVALGDAAAVGRTAHTLKGMISNFCSPAAHDSAVELEKLGKEGELSAAPAAVRAMEVRLAELITALTDFLATRT